MTSPDRPLVVVLAGPNGAGKSTCAPPILRGSLAVREFVNADTIAEGLSAYHPEAAAIAAGRIMLTRLSTLARERCDFAFETTLAGHGHAAWLRELRASGYRTHLVFLALESADLAVRRVRERFARGGHDVPEGTIRRRFQAGLWNPFHGYLDAMLGWHVFESSDPKRLLLVAHSFAGSTYVHQPDVWRELEEKSTR